MYSTCEIDELLARQHASLACERIRLAHEPVPGLFAEEAAIVLKPRVCHRRSVRHHQHRLRVQTLHKVIDGQSLSEPRLAVPEEFRHGGRAAHAALEIRLRLLHRPFLLITQLIGNHSFVRPQHAVVLPESVKRILRLGLRDLEPLVVCALLLLDTHAAQIDVEVFVVERHAGPVFEHGVALPLQCPANPSRMRLLADSSLHVALRVTDFRPAVVVRHARRNVCVDFWLYAFSSLDVRCCHR